MIHDLALAFFSALGAGALGTGATLAVLVLRIGPEVPRDTVGATANPGATADDPPGRAGANPVRT